MEELAYLQCGILLLDVGNAGDNGFQVIEAVTRAKPSCPIIAMTEAADTRVVVEALRRGAIDFITKPIGASALHEAVASAGAILEQRRQHFEQVESDRIALGRLTARERDVLCGMADGKISKKIAWDLSLSVRTVETYRSALIEKLGVETAGAAITVIVRYETALLAHGLHGSAARSG